MKDTIIDAKKNIIQAQADLTNIEKKSDNKIQNSTLEKKLN